jgi:ATP-dependent Clp protease ATP-binding subunit ClpA
MTAVKKLLLPEFLGRLTHVIVCSPLTEEQIEDIVVRELRLAKEEWHLTNGLTIKQSALRAIVQQVRSEAEQYGARRVRRIVRDLLADALLESGTDTPVTIYHESGQFVALRRSA